MHGFCIMGNMSNTKIEILQYASTRMQEVGIRSLSVDDICHELGISKKTFYVHFASKDVLIEAMLLAGEEQIRQKVQQMVSNKTVTQCIVIWHNIARTSDNVKQTPPVLYDLQKYYPQLLKDHHRRIHDGMRELMAQFLLKGQNEGIFRQEVDVQFAAQLLVDVHERYVERVTQSTDPKTLIDSGYSKSALDILLRGLFTAEGMQALEQEVKVGDEAIGR